MDVLFYEYEDNFLFLNYKKSLLNLHQIFHHRYLSASMISVILTIKFMTFRLLNQKQSIQNHLQCYSKYYVNLNEMNLQLQKQTINEKISINILQSQNSSFSYFYDACENFISRLQIAPNMNSKYPYIITKNNGVKQTHNFFNQKLFYIFFISKFTLSYNFQISIFMNFIYYEQIYI